MQTVGQISIQFNKRGLRGVRLVISDANLGLVESVSDYYPEADWQRCVVHFYRNVFSHVPNGKVKQVSLMLKAIHAQESYEAARKKSNDVIQDLKAMRLQKASEWVEDVIEETLTFYRYPQGHWIRIRTNNPPERIMREIRRRTRVVGAFPDGKSAIMLCAARLRHIAGTKWGTRKYLLMDELYQDQKVQQIA